MLVLIEFVRLWWNSLGTKTAVDEIMIEPKPPTDNIVVSANSLESLEKLRDELSLYTQGLHTAEKTRREHISDGYLALAENDELRIQQYHTKINAVQRKIDAFVPTVAPVTVKPVTMIDQERLMKATAGTVGTWPDLEE